MIDICSGVGLISVLNAFNNFCILLYHSQKFEEKSDGSLVVSFTAGALLEMCFHLVTWEGEIEIIEPAGLKTVMKDLIKNIERCVGK